MASHVVRAKRWHNRRTARPSTRRPLSPSTMLRNFDGAVGGDGHDSSNVGEERGDAADPSGASHATPRTAHDRAIRSTWQAGHSTTWGTRTPGRRTSGGCRSTPRSPLGARAGRDSPDTPATTTPARSPRHRGPTSAPDDLRPSRPRPHALTDGSGERVRVGVAVHDVCLHRERILSIDSRSGTRRAVRRCECPSRTTRATSGA